MGRSPQQNDPRPTPRARALALLFFVLAPMGLGASGSAQVIYAFRNYTRPEPIRMLLVGEIRSKVKVPRPRDNKSPYIGYDARLDQVTVKVANRKGLKVGQKLFVIDKNPYHKRYRNGLISGEIKVRSIFYHPFFGWVLTGTGILLRVREGMFVARTLETEKLERAFERKKRGDFHRDRGELEQAIASYHSALEADRGLPEAHAALGRIYLAGALKRRRETPVRALAELEMAWKRRLNFRYDSELYDFLLNYLDGLHYARQTAPRQGRNRRLEQYVRRAKEVSRAALALKSNSPEARYHAALANFELVSILEVQGRMLAKQADRLTPHSPKHTKALEAYQARGKESRAAYQEALRLVGELTGESITDGRVHALAFLVYAELLAQVRATQSPDEQRRLTALANYSANFKRWRDVRLPDVSAGNPIEQLLLYHGELYYRFLGGKRADPRIAKQYRALQKQR